MTGFPDLIGRWSESVVNAVSRLRVLRGDDRGNFRPTDPITREEVAQLTARLLIRDWEGQMALRVLASTFTLQGTGQDGHGYSATAWCRVGNELYTVKHGLYDEDGLPLTNLTAVWHAGPQLRYPVRVLEEVSGQDLARVELLTQDGPWMRPWAPLRVGGVSRLRPCRRVLLVGAPYGAHGVPAWDVTLLREGRGTIRGETQPLWTLDGYLQGGFSGAPVLVWSAEPSQETAGPEPLEPVVVGILADSQADNPHPSRLAHMIPVGAWPPHWL